MFCSSLHLAVSRFPAALLFAAATASLHAQAAGRFENLGAQVKATTIQGSAFVRSESGATLAYTVVRGEPAHLLGYELPDGRKVVDIPLPNTGGAWNLTVSSDGWLYVPGGEGHVFRHRPGSATVEDLGVAIAGETSLWDVCAGNDGEIFGGTYPGCRVFRYHPRDGFSDVGHGPIVAGENYVRAVAFDARTGKVYAGVGSHAHLVELDPHTGAKRELLPEKYDDQEAAYSLCVVPDEKDGDRLLVWVTNLNQTLVLNLRTGKYERTFASGGIKAAIRPPDSRLVYFSQEPMLCAFDLDHPDAEPVKLTRCLGVQATRMREDGKIDILTRYAGVVSFDPATRKTHSVALQIPPQPIPIQSIILGPDGRLWIGGFLAGGHAAFDPATGKTELYKGLSQTERMTVLGSKIYFGIYPHGRLYVYDTTRPWRGEENPKRLGAIPEQSRPIAALALPDAHRVLFGTVPEYGHLGGAVVTIDEATGKFEVNENVVANQSIVSLCQAGDVVIGGSSIFGGLGGKPSEHEAKIFGWDPVGRKKLYELVPVSGAKAVTALLSRPDRTVWGVADGTLFIFDPATREVRSRQKLFAVGDANSDRFVWRDAFLVAHPSGKIYGTIDGHFFRLDPETMAVTDLGAAHADLLTMDREGRLYFRKKTELWRYTP